MNLPPPLGPILSIWLVATGLAVGSFLNVVIARLPHEESVVKPRSRCPRCGHTLSWWENLPVLSWLLLRAKCRGCKLPISARYPLVELLTGALWLGCLWRFGWSLELVSGLVLVTVLVPLTFIDLDHWILPFSLTLPGIVLGLLAAIPLGLVSGAGGWIPLRDRLIGAVVAFLGFWAMERVGEWIFKKEALGGGDKYLLALLGAFLGYQPLLGIVFLSSLQGSIVGVTLLLIHGRAGPAPAEEAAEASPGKSTGASPGTQAPAPDDTKSKASEGGDDEEDDWVPGPTNMPFGPWLALAGVEILLFGPLMASYLPWPTSLLFGGS